MAKNPFYLPFSRPWIDDTEIEAVSQVLASKWISTGNRVREFERAFAEYLGVKHAIAVSSCTAALHLSSRCRRYRERRRSYHNALHLHCDR